MRTFATAVAVLLVLSLPACTEPETEVDSTTVVESETTLTDHPSELRTDEELTQDSFVEKVATDGIMEVQLGEMAQQKAQSADVKSFGEMMVRDHSRANDELEQIASNLNVTLPATLTPEQQENVDKLTRLDGAEFDREYMSIMVDDHETAVDLFEDASEGDLPAELKQFATKTLPTLENHLERAKELESDL